MLLQLMVNQPMVADYCVLSNASLLYMEQNGGAYLEGQLLDGSGGRG